MVQFYFLLFWPMVIYDNEFETKKNNIRTKDKTEPQHIHQIRTSIQAFRQTLKTGHPEGIFSHKTIKDYVNFPCIFFLNGRS